MERHVVRIDRARWNDMRRNSRIGLIGATVAGLVLGLGLTVTGIISGNTSSVIPGILLLLMGVIAGWQFWSRRHDPIHPSRDEAVLFWLDREGLHADPREIQLATQHDQLRARGRRGAGPDTSAGPGRGAGAGRGDDPSGVDGTHSPDAVDSGDAAVARDFAAAEDWPLTRRWGEFRLTWLHKSGSYLEMSLDDGPSRRWAVLVLDTTRPELQQVIEDLSEGRSRLW